VVQITDTFGPLLGGHVLVTLGGAITIGAQVWSPRIGLLTTFGGWWQIDQGVDGRPTGLIGQVQHGLQHQAAGGVGHVHLFRDPILLGSSGSCKFPKN